MQALLQQVDEGGGEKAAQVEGDCARRKRRRRGRRRGAGGGRGGCGGPGSDGRGGRGDGKGYGACARRPEPAAGANAPARIATTARPTPGTAAAFPVLELGRAARDSVERGGAGSGRGGGGAAPARPSGDVPTSSPDIPYGRSGLEAGAPRVHHQGTVGEHCLPG